MDWLVDLFKEPLSAVLKDKIASIEAKYAAIETENASLRDDLRLAQAEITKLKNQIEETRQTHGLDKLEIELLKLLASSEIAHDAKSLAVALQWNHGIVEHRLKNLVYLKYAERSATGSLVAWATVYTLTQAGQEYLIRNNLM
jgi:DNA-binding MarR family transcriptional regulator